MAKKYKNKKGKKKVSKQLRSAIKTVYGQMEKANTEYKHFLTAYTWTKVALGAANSVFTCLTNVPQGAAYNQRTGDELTITSIHVKLLLDAFNHGYNAPGTPGQEHVIWRVIIFQFKDDDTTAPVPINLVGTSVCNPPGTVSVGPMAARNQNYLEQYVSLYDKTIHTAFYEDGGYGGSYGLYEQQKYLNIRVPLKYAKRKIQFKSTGSVNALNNIYMWVTNNADPAVYLNGTKYPQYMAEFEVAFTDK